MMDNTLVSAQTSRAIEPLVPHRGSMLWLTRVIASDENSVIAEGVVQRDHVFAQEQHVPAWTGIEYMAQAVAAWAGLRAEARGVPVKPGFLLGTRRYECHRARFAFGLLLRVEARCEMFGDNGMGVFACRLFDGDEVIAEANLSVFEPPESTDYLQESRS